MTKQWVAADLKTGRIGPDLPALIFPPDQVLRRSLSGFDTATADLALAGAPENWLDATRPGAALLACYDDETLPDGTTPNAILWAGYVTARTRNGDADTVTLTMATLEAYFDRCYSGDESHAGGWRATLAATVTANVKTGAEPGIDLLQLKYTGDGEAPTDPLLWQNADNVTILGRMQQLIGQFGGEFTIEWAWSVDGLSLVPTLVFGDRIGFESTTRLPPVTFEYPGTVTDPSQVEDFSDGKGANKLVAFSATGEVLPVVYADDFEGRPTFEYRYSPQTSITDDGTLLDYARQAMKVLAAGSNSVTVSLASADERSRRGRRLGVDWFLGDDVGYLLTAPAWPDGLYGVGRVVAYEITDTTVSPVFAESSIYGGS